MNSNITLMVFEMLPFCAISHIDCVFEKLELLHDGLRP